MEKGRNQRITEELLDLATNAEKNEVEIKKKITGVLSLVSTIASYSKSKNYDLDKITTMANMTYQMLGIENYALSDFMLKGFCNAVNSIRFDFTKKDLKINNSKNRRFNLQNKIDPIVKSYF